MELQKLIIDSNNKELVNEIVELLMLKEENREQLLHQLFEKSINDKIPEAAIILMNNNLDFYATKENLDKAVEAVLLSNNVEAYKEFDKHFSHRFDLTDVQEWLITLIKYHHTDLFKAVLELNSLQANIDNNILIRTACNVGVIEIVRFLIEECENTNFRDYNDEAIHLAVSKRHNDIVQYLLTEPSYNELSDHELKKLIDIIY
jgi:hypothetical protein